MWDYDKLFAEDNIVGIIIEDGEDVYNQVVSNPDYWRDGQEINWNLYKNEKLSSCEETGFEFKIQYIIRLDEHGNVVEKLFDRERDMKPEPEPMPELEDGMFVRVKSRYGKTLGYVDMNQDRIIFQDGSWDRPSNIPYWKSIQLLEVYPSGLNCFDSCLPERKIWCSPEYQSDLNSKEPR